MYMVQKRGEWFRTLALKMGYNKERTIWFLCCICVALCSEDIEIGRTHYPGIRYMEEECNHTDYTTTDMRLRLTFDTEMPLEVNWTCHTRVMAEHPNTALHVSYIDLNTDWSERCRKNSLYIFDSNGLVLNSLDGDCGTDPPKDQYLSSGTLLTFLFQTDDSRQTGNFDLLITPVAFQTDNGTCPEDSFLCRNKRCVSKIVTCNGFNDCGDNSDEIDNCSNVPTWIIVGFACVLGTSVLISLVIFFAQYRRRKYHRLSHTNTRNTTDGYIYNDRPGYQQYEKHSNWN